MNMIKHASPHGNNRGIHRRQSTETATTGPVDDARSVDCVEELHELVVDLIFDANLVTGLRVHTAGDISAVLGEVGDPLLLEPGVLGSKVAVYLGVPWRVPLGVAEHVAREQILRIAA